MTTALRLGPVQYSSHLPIQVLHHGQKIAQNFALTVVSGRRLYVWKNDGRRSQRSLQFSYGRWICEC